MARLFCPLALAIRRSNRFDRKTASAIPPWSNLSASLLLTLPDFAPNTMLQITNRKLPVQRLLNTTFAGDAYDLFEDVPPSSVDLIITSPPYWGHRDYELKHNCGSI